MSETQVRPDPVMGLYDAPLWEYVKQKELRLQRCADCGEFRYPPGSHCPNCLSENFEWARLSGRGRVYAWCVFHRQYFPEIAVPNPIVMVQTEEGPIVAANLVGSDPSVLRLDLPMEVTFEPVRWANGKEGMIFQWRLAK
ncbi:MAG TPA: OB-fold domain-containing protein [Candidatus Binataceae bacterium]|nr:OB-fold domain-containing protein [Candidatus Binataceae bacterium]